MSAKIGDVTLVKGCMICHTEVILMAKKNIRQDLPKQGEILPEVCKECRAKYLTKGVLLINPNNGRFVVLKDEAFQKVFNVDVPEGKIAFTDDELLDKLQGQSPNTEDKDE